MDTRVFFLAVICACICPALHGQNVSVSTNLVDYADFGTLNLDASCAVAQHWSINAGMKYNPFSFPGGADGGNMQSRQQTYSIGTRYWPWHIFSGWWACVKAQYQEYNRGGISSPETCEGDRFGAGLSGGYTYMLGRHFNIEAGAGVWGGADKYTVYSCPTCGRTLDKGNKTFVMLNEVLLSLTYVF